MSDSVVIPVCSVMIFFLCTDLPGRALDALVIMVRGYPTVDPKAAKHEDKSGD